MSVESVLEKVREIMGAGSADAPHRAESTWRTYLETNPKGHDRCLALAGLAESLTSQGRHGDAEEAFRAALSHAADPVERITVLVGYAKLVHDVQRSTIAESVAAQLLTTLQTSPAETACVASWAYSYHACMLLLIRDLPGAYASARMAVDAAYACKPVAGLAEAYQTLSDVQKAMGDLPEAMASLEEAMVAMRQGHCLMEARADYAEMALARGDLKTAESSLMRAVQFPDMRDRRVFAKVVRGIRAMYKSDPDAGDRLSEILASRLEGTTGPPCGG